ncbi:MAG: hypothetical protein R3B09_23345 [Nannocystaceae bacterium]
MLASSIRSTALLAAALALACAGDDGSASSQTGSTGLSTSDGTTGTTGESTSEATTTSTSTSTSTTTTTTTSTSTTSTTSTTDETTAASATTTTENCPAGSVGCPCDAGTCDEGLNCVSDTCVTPIACDPVDVEPNNTEATAQDLGMITDDDDDKTSISGVLAGKGDVDWFTFIGTDTVFHTTEPTRTVTADMGLRFCKFIECLGDGPALTEITCPAGTDFAISPQLRPGCCSGEGFVLDDYNCPGSDDSLKIFFRLDKALFDECVEYTIDYFL